MVWLCLLIATPTTTPMAKQINSFIENTSRVAWIVERNYLTSLRQSVSRTHEAVVIVALVTPIPASQRSLDKLASSSTKPGPDAPLYSNQKNFKPVLPKGEQEAISFLPLWQTGV
jgi:hypothetical protein